MGGVLSKGRETLAAASATSTGSVVEDKNGIDKIQIRALAEETDSTKASTSQDHAQEESKTASNPSSSELPADMQFILESGLYKDVDEGAASPGSGQQGSIQDAVNDLKAKYNIGQPVAVGELDRIRKEIELKTRLMQMREAQQQKRIAQQFQAAAQADTQTGAKAVPIYKVDVKGKGRAEEPSDDEISDSEDDDSSDDDSDSGSSSSSGSSIGLKRPAQKGKRQPHAADQEEGNGSEDDDDGIPVGKLKPEEIAQAAALFASTHEILEPTIPPRPVESLPADAPLRPIGTIDHIINTVIVVRADINAQETLQGQILDEGSLLSLGDRRVLGAIFETFGSVTSPYYSIRLPAGHPLLVKTLTSDGAQHEPVTAGMQVFYSPAPDFSGLLYTRDIQRSQMKGSDASNLYDEEVGENEIEFSDDEEETDYRRELKQRKKDRWQQRQDDSVTGGAEFEFEEEDFDDGASVRSVANRSHEIAEVPAGVKLDEEEEEGAIDESAPARKRKLSLSMGSSHGNEAKTSRQDGSSRGGRGRGGHERSRGRGRGAHNAERGAGRGRGASRGGQDRGRGRGRGRGAEHPPRGAPARLPYERPSVSHGLPARPAYQHPDALPYDDVQVASYQPTRSMSPVRPQHALPPRPLPNNVEQYDPASPRQPVSASLSMNPQAQPWSPPSMYPTPQQSSYTPQMPFFPQAPMQHFYPSPAFGQAAPMYQASPYQQQGYPGMSSQVYGYAHGAGSLYQTNNGGNGGRNEDHADHQG